MAQTIENLFRILHYTCDILILLLFLIFYKKNKSEKSLVLIATYVFIELFLNAFNKYFSRDIYLYVWSTFTFIEYSIFAFILWSNIKKSLIRKAIFISSICFVLFTSVFNIATNFENIDSIPIAIETILILVYSFYYLYEQLNETNNLFIYHKYQFWLIIGFLIYLAGSFFVFLLANRMENEKMLEKYWILTHCFYVAMAISFIISLIIYSKHFTKLPSSKSPLGYA
jgi:hypothetical protein